MMTPERHFPDQGGLPSPWPEIGIGLLDKLEATATFRAPSLTRMHCRRFLYTVFLVPLSY